MNEPGYSLIFSEATGRDLQVEYRGKYGWFIVEKGQTLMGFQTKKLLVQYYWKVVKRGGLYTPTASETYRR